MNFLGSLGGPLCGQFQVGPYGVFENNKMVIVVTCLLVNAGLRIWLGLHGSRFSSQEYFFLVSVVYRIS